MRIKFFVAVGIVGAAAMLAACGSENRAEPTATTHDGTTIAAVTTSSGTCRGCATCITYTPRKPDGSEPTDAESEQARRIIDERVAEFGIAHDVTVGGKTVVATLHNDDGADAEEFGRMPEDVRQAGSSIGRCRNAARAIATSFSVHSRGSARSLRQCHPRRTPICSTKAVSTARKSDRQHRNSTSSTNSP
ncbi:hypothetical protein [Nocardia nova]|uniref:hypothetical protein n=1 Tax=Nocardia nova TaxID=37330 RepID=UPI0011B040F8|nr:hypothetical protein [Nocardia nova]